MKLNATSIRKSISSAHNALIERFEIFHSINSTNDYLLKLMSKQGLYVCIADKQTQGRGRQGKKWASPAGNIYFSLGCQLSSQSTINGLSLATAVQTLEALKAIGIHADIQMKWPNDIYVQNQKLAGILIETFSKQNLLHVVIGIGLNLESPSLKTGIGLNAITLKAVNRNLLLGQLIESLIIGVQLYKEKGLAPFIETWRSNDMLLNKFIVIRDGDAEYSGISQGINDQGEMIFRDEYGRHQIYRTGEVSIVHF